VSLHITIHFSRPRCFADFLVQFSSFIIGYKSVNFENISITENKILDWEKCVKCEDFYSRKIYINCKNQSTLRILIEGCFQNETPQINEGRLYTYFLQSWSQKPKRHVGTCSQPTLQMHVPHCKLQAALFACESVPRKCLALLLSGCYVPTSN